MTIASTAGWVCPARLCSAMRRRSGRSRVGRITETSGGDATPFQPAACQPAGEREDPSGDGRGAPVRQWIGEAGQNLDERTELVWSPAGRLWHRGCFFFPCPHL